MATPIELLASAARSGSGSSDPIDTANVALLRLTLTMSACTGTFSEVDPGSDVQAAFNLETAPAADGPWRLLPPTEARHPRQTAYTAVGSIPRTEARTFVGPDAYTRATWVIRPGATVTCALSGTVLDVTEGPEEP